MIKINLDKVQRLGSKVRFLSVVQTSMLEGSKVQAKLCCETYTGNAEQII